MNSTSRRPRAALGALSVAAAASLTFAACTASSSTSSQTGTGMDAALVANAAPTLKAPSTSPSPTSAAQKQAAAQKVAAAKQQTEAQKAAAKRRAALLASQRTVQAQGFTSSGERVEATTDRAEARRAAKQRRAEQRAKAREERRKAREARKRQRQVETPAPVAPTLSALPTATATATATVPVQSPAPVPMPVVAPTVAPEPTTAPTVEQPTAAPSVAPEPTAAPSATAPGTVGELDLPRIPWEGGSKYWSQFRNANKAGWAKDDFFPVAVWWNSHSTDEEVQYDKSLGINTYVEMDPSADYKRFERNDVYWVGPKLNDTFTDDSTNWVGNFLGDEVDGRFEPAEGLRQMRENQAKGKQGPRFNYANFTGLMVSSYFKQADAEAYMATTDAASMDMYWYTVPFCNWDNYNENYYIFKVPQAHCRTSASYGKVMEGMRTRDAADGKLQPLWNFIELSDPNLPGQKSYGPIKPAQIKGAAMSSVINEARGLIYYNQDYGQCSSGNLMRHNQFTKDFCAKGQIEAMGEVNNFLHKMAPVLNTQSYEWDFGKGLDTMLKSKDGNAYIFAMIDGNDHAGSRTFTLPAELKGRTIEVVDENRTITPNADGTFTDTFASESTYHVYKLS